MEFRNLLNFVFSLSIIYLLAFIPFIYNTILTFSFALLGVNLAQWLMTFTRKYVLHETICPKNKAVLITGCDSGFGNALARRMDKAGYSVYATCLFANGQEAKKLCNDCSEKLKVLPMDVTDDQSVQEAKESVKNSLGQNVLWAVVNNAGIAQAGEIDWTSFEEIQQVYNVNTAGTLRVTKAFLPFIKKSKGRIINVASLGGRCIHPGMVAYCMSKTAVIAFTTGLRLELARWGVKAISIEPFFYSTPITGLQTIVPLIKKTWKAAPEDIKEEYGEHYIDSFKKAAASYLGFCRNPNVFEVIDCLEDAITAKEPLSTYCPISIFHKLYCIFFTLAPSSTQEFFFRLCLATPLAISSKKKQ